MRSEALELHRTLNARLECPLWHRLPRMSHHPALRGYHQRRLDERVWQSLNWPVRAHLERQAAGR